MTIRQVIFISMLVTTAGFFGGASLNAWKRARSVSLPVFLICLAILLAHDAYGNRLLPPPNRLAQIAGYLEASWCVALAALFLWKSPPS